MLPLPPEGTPLYNHTLRALEQWLRQLGAEQEGAHAVEWALRHGGWSARITLETEDLVVVWQGEGGERQRRFAYGLTRADVEAAILAGP
jgi:hypothetical protein